MGVLALDDLTFKLDGDYIRIRATSGDTKVDLIVSVRRARKYFHAAEGVLAKWEANKADAVPIGKGKKPKH